jgi:ADP-ribose pyrophosphatase
MHPTPDPTQPTRFSLVAISDRRGRLLMQERDEHAPVAPLCWSLPGGGRDGDESPLANARRELEEETGLRAASWRKLGTFYSAPGFTDELMHLYIATDLAPADPDGRLGPDEDERLILEWRPWRDAVAAAERGEIRDAKSLVGLFWLARVKETG